VVRRLTGRPVQVPDARELVALGAAVQAAAVLAGEPPEGVARRWDGSAGTRLDPLPLDEDRLERVRAALARAIQESGRAGTV
jgi:xylulokinase